MAGVLVGGLGLGLLGSGCHTVVMTVTTQVPPSNINPNSKLIRQFKDRYGRDQFVYEVSVHDPDGYFSGKVLLQRQNGHGAAAVALAAFRSARISGRISVTTDSVIHLDALAVVSAKTGSYCVSMSGKTDLRYPNQILQGQFTIVGGTGVAARLHVAGPLLGVQPKAEYDLNNPGPLTIYTAAKSASLATPRGLNAACRQAAKPPPPRRPSPPAWTGSRSPPRASQPCRRARRSTRPTRRSAATSAAARTTTCTSSFPTRGRKERRSTSATSPAPAAREARPQPP
jgi:hypothetical protein